MRIGLGGQGANLAVRLARRGATVELVCALGDDPGGTLVREALGREGVGLSVVATDATGTVVILLDQHGERTMLSQRAPFAAGAGTRPCATASRGWSYRATCFSRPMRDELAGALASAPADGVRLVGCAVPDAMADDWARAAAALRPDLVVLNRDEARTLIPGTSDTDDLRMRLGERLGTGVVVTEPDGATARLNGLSAAVRAPRPRIGDRQHRRRRRLCRRAHRLPAALTVAAVRAGARRRVGGRERARQRRRAGGRRPGPRCGRAGRHPPAMTSRRSSSRTRFGPRWTAAGRWLPSSRA